MKRILVLVALLPVIVSAQYRVPVWSNNQSGWLFLRPGPNITITATGIDCVVPAPLPASLRTPVVVFPADGQRTITLTIAEPVKAVDIYRNGALLADVAKLAAAPDYTLSVDNKTIILGTVHTGVVGDIIVVMVYK